jgi:hypothetical protein
MPIPDWNYERDLSSINNLHCSLVTWLSIIKNASLRTTVHGDRHIEAERQIKATLAKIENGLKEYNAMVLAVANGERTSESADFE